MRKRILLLFLLMITLPVLGLAEGFPPTSTPTIPGIDVSDWQGDIDWSLVYQSGVRIAMIRASEGSHYVDSRFDANARGAREAGLHVGYYHFMTAQTEEEARSQADFFLETIAGYEADCLLALDDGAGKGLSGEQLSRCAVAFMERVEAQSGLGIMLYTDAWAAKARYTDAVAIYPIWVANYGVEEPETNGKWSAWVGFQYSDRGRIDGISGYVDLNHFTREVYQGAAPTPAPTATPSPTPAPTPSPSPVPGGAIACRQWPEDASLSLVAAELGATADVLAGMNFIQGDTVRAGQLIRYPSGGAGDFAGLHILQARESLSTVARRYGVSPDTLAAMNGLADLHASKGQVLRVPAYADRPDAAAPPAWILENAVVVQAGQTLASLSAQYGMTAEELAAINGLSANAALRRGQILHLRTYGKDSAQGFTGGYVVNQGDTLSGIAGWFGCTVEALYDRNNIAMMRLIFPGQVLLLPE